MSVASKSCNCFIFLEDKLQVLKVGAYIVCLKAVKEIGEKKDQTQQCFYAGEQEQQNCQFCPFFLWVSSKSISLSSSSASGNQPCCQVVHFYHFKYQPESTAGFSAAFLFHIINH